MLYHCFVFVELSNYFLFVSVSTISAIEIESPEPELHLIEGETLRLEYKLSTEERQLHFFKNNNYIAEAKKIVRERIGVLNVLTIKNVTPEDKGIYHAAFTNIRSEVTKLTVQGKLFSIYFDHLYYKNYITCMYHYNTLLRLADSFSRHSEINLHLKTKCNNHDDTRSLNKVHR